MRCLKFSERNGAQNNSLTFHGSDRASVSNSKPRPTLSCFHATPQKTQPPPNAPEWMISNADNDEVLAPNTPN